MTTAIPTEIKVLMNHIYELDKGVRRVLKQGGKFAIMVEVVDGDSMWTNVVEGMTAYSLEELKTMLDEAGFVQTEIHRMKPSNATIIGVKR